jgi:hypothetical protein
MASRGERRVEKTRVFSSFTRAIGIDKRELLRSKWRRDECCDREERKEI